MAYWLLKTEPGTFSWEDLWNSPDRSTRWEGVRNYQARNFLRDAMKVGDGVLLDHSVVVPQVIAGIAEVVREGYPDHVAWDPDSRDFDPKSTPGDPRWFMADIRAVRPFEPPITREELKGVPELRDMMLLRRGSRLSVQPVSPGEWETILALRG